MKRRICRILLALLALIAGMPVSAETRLVVIVGLAGESQFEQVFSDWATSLINTATERFAMADDAVLLLAAQALLSSNSAEVEMSVPPATTREETAAHADSAGEKTPTPPVVDDIARKENIVAQVQSLANEVQENDTTMIVLIGHGNERDGEAWFNIPGPDMSGTDFAALFERFPGRLAFINTTPASAAFSEALAAPGRIIITATSTGSERFHTRFGGYFVTALSAERADVNKDRRVSLYEAFEYARIEVERFYATDKRLQTEHPLLEDNGDGVGSAVATLDPAQGGDGAAAYRFYLAAAVHADATDPIVQKLLDEKAELNVQLNDLRARKAQLDPDQFDTQLEDILLELALVNRQLKAQTDAPKPSRPVQ